jgi:hypothetical protein
MLLKEIKLIIEIVAQMNKLVCYHAWIDLNALNILTHLKKRDQTP